MEQVQKKDLRHCPFCGDEATIREFATGCRGNGEFTASYKVGCGPCGIYFTRESRFTLENGYPVFSTNGYDVAVELWNRRASDAD